MQNKEPLPVFNLQRLLLWPLFCNKPDNHLRQDISVIFIFTVTSCLAGINVLVSSAASSMLAEWGNYLSQKYYDTNNMEGIYAQGERACITNSDKEQVQEFYILSGMEEQAALEKAVQYVREREVIQD